MKMFIAIVLCSGLVPYLTKGSETKDKLKRLIFKICIEIDIDCGHCADTIPNCADYTQAVCTDAAYSNWVEKNCKRFCNLCPKGSSGSVPQPVRRSTSTCSDKLAECSAYGTSSCTGQYVQWATENCAKTCNLCPSRSASATGASSGGVPVPGTGSSGGTFSGSSTGCFYNSQIYREGTTWNDGCKYKCRCTDGMSGKYECKQLMSNTKQTPRKRALCPRCETDIPTEEYIVHTRSCVGKPVCTVCKKIYTSQKNLKQHIRRIHIKKDKVKVDTASVKKPVEKSETEDQKNDDGDSYDDDDEWDKDPEIELDFEDNVEDSLLEGRTVRKATTPAPVFAPKKKVLAEAPVEKAEEIKLSNDHYDKESSDSSDTDESEVVEKYENKNVPKVKAKQTSPKLGVEEKGVQANLESKQDVVNLPRCEVCRVYFDNDVLYSIHRGIHSVDNPLRCNICGIIFPDSLSLFTHLTWGHKA